MSHVLTFLHTSPVHIATFNTLLAEDTSPLPVQHIVEESLLREVCQQGEITPQVKQRVQEIISIAVEEGASVVVCTCSSIGAVAEALNGSFPATVMRIDRPMAQEAVALGSRIIVAATLTTTLEPTRNLILSAAYNMQKEVEIIDLLCEKAWSYFEQGNQSAYLQEIAQQLELAATSGDVIVLAQASMASAISLCSALSIPVLTSPRSGLAAAIKAYRSHS